MPLVVGNVEAESKETLPDPMRMGVYTWRIKQYSTYTTEDRIDSPTFKKGGFHWYMSLNPKGSKTAKKGYMSIYLYHSAGDDIFSVQRIEPPRAKFSIKIRNQLGKEGGEYIYTAVHSFEAGDSSWGFRNFAKVDRLLTKRCGLVVGDVLKVELRMSVQSKNVSTSPTDNSEEAKTVVIRLLTDRQIRRDVETVLLSDLLVTGDEKTYCVDEQIRFQSFKELVGHDLGIAVEDLRFWLCEQLSNDRIRFVLNLEAAKGKLDRISDLTKLRSKISSSMSQAGSMEVVHLYVE